MNVYEMIAFIAYFVLVIGVGIYFFFKSKGNAGEKDYFSWRKRYEWSGGCTQRRSI